MKVFRTGLLDAADASDIGVPAVPFRRLHAEPAAAALEAAGGRVRASTPVRAVSAGAELTLEDGTDDVDAVILALPHDAVAELAPAGAVDARGARRPRHEPDREPARALRPARARRAARRRARLAGAVALRPHGGLGRPRGPAGRDLALARGRRDRRARSPSCATATCPRSSGSCRPPAARRCSTSPSRTSPAPRSAPRPGTAKLRPGPRTAVPGVYLAGSWTDTGWPATMESAVRSGLAAASSRSPRRRTLDEVRRMTVTADRQIDAGAGEPRARDRAPALAAASRRLVEGRARDERDDRLRGPLPAPLPRPARRAAEPRRPPPGSASRQRPDGSWATYFGGPGDLSTSVEAYVALRLAGDPADAAHMRRAAAFVREAGGVAGSRVFTRMWLSLLGLWSWAEVPTLPPEQILLPVRAPLSIYSFGCWARQTIVALSIVTALRPSTARSRSGSTSCAAPPCRRRRRPTPGDGPSSCSTARSTPTAAGLPPRCVVARCATAERWVVERQERDGSWGGIQPPWVWSIVGLHALGYDLDHPVIVRALAGLDAFTIEDELGRRLEACQSPVWDTALVGDRAARRRRPRRRPGRRARLRVARRAGGLDARRLGRPPAGLAAGGFPFEFANENYPDVDDTAVVVLALRRAGHDPTGAAGRGLEWMLGMQSRSGGFGAFDVDNESSLCARLAFCDFGAVTDPPSSDVTAHVLETLAFEGRARRAACGRGRSGGCSREQERDGSWFGRWGANYVYGTGSVAAGARRMRPRRARERPRGGAMARARAESRWWVRGGSPVVSRPLLERARRLDRVADGLGAHRPARRRRGGRRGRRGRAFGGSSRRSSQTAAGTSRTSPGTGFPGDFYLNYHLYRDVFPVMALGRVLGSRR